MYLTTFWRVKYCRLVHYIIALALETVPVELKTQLEALAAKDVQFEEARKALFKKRNLYLRAEEKGLDATLQAALLRKTEKEQHKLLAIIDEKIEIEIRLQSLVEQHLNHFEVELTGKLGISRENPYISIFADIPNVERSDRPSNNRLRSSPKKRFITHSPHSPITLLLDKL
jgi:hypothetical protein